MASKREIIGGLASVAIHAGFLAWVSGHAPPTEPSARAEPVPVEVELLELTPPTPQPLALKADSGREQTSQHPELPSGEVVEPQPQPAPQPAPRPATQQVPSAIQPEPPTEPDPDATTEATTEAPSAPQSAAPEPLPSAPDEHPSVDPDGSRPRGIREGTGNIGTGGGGVGIDGTADHSAYGAKLVHLIMTEIDEDPVPGLGPRDSIEVELTVLPSGRLAHRGIGKYDYARVVRSTLGPIRLRAILRRILRASKDFPPHPSSFPRTRYVVGITVRFRDLRG